MRPTDTVGMAVLKHYRIEQDEGRRPAGDVAGVTLLAFGNSAPDCFTGLAVATSHPEGLLGYAPF